MVCKDVCACAYLINRIYIYIYTHTHPSRSGLPSLGRLHVLGDVHTRNMTNSPPLGPYELDPMYTLHALIFQLGQLGTCTGFYMFVRMWEFRLVVVNAYLSAGFNQLFRTDR